MGRIVTQSIDLHDSPQEAVSKYITEIDEHGISVHPENDSDNCINISNIIEFKNKGQTVAAYGAETRIGDEDGYNTHIGSKNVALRNGIANIFKVDTESLVARFLEADEDIFKVSYASGKEGKHLCSSVLFDGENTVTLTDIPPDSTQIAIDIYCAFVGFENNPKVFSTTVKTPSTSGMTAVLSKNYGWEAAAGSYGEHLPSGTMRLSGRYGYQSSTMPLTISFTGVTLSSAVVYISWDSGTTGESELMLIFGNRVDNSNNGMFSSSFGKELVASGQYSFAEGYGALANGVQSHAEGFGTKAIGANSHAQNNSTIAYSANQTALGKYNVIDDNDEYTAIIGNGTADDARNNAVAVTWDGDVHTCLKPNSDTIDDKLYQIAQTYPEAIISENTALGTATVSLKSLLYHALTWD